jgi:hypothetical protein
LGDFGTFGSLVQNISGHTASKQGCQIFLDTKYQNGEKIYQITTKLPNDPKIYQMAVTYLHIPYGNKVNQRFLFQGPPKYNPKCDIWF